MPITFSCGCGRSLKVADELAGKRVRCPACNKAAEVPPADDGGFEVVDDEPPKPVRATVAKAVPAKAKPPEEDFELVDDDEEDVKPKKKKRRDDDERPAKRTSQKSKRYDDDDDEEEDDRPRKKKRKSQPAEASGGMRLLYIFGGIALVIAGVAVAYFSWQSEGRRVGRGIGLGVVLAIVGTIGVYRGATGEIDVGEDDDDD